MSNKSILSLLMFSALLLTGSVDAKALKTSLSDDPEALQDQPMLGCTPTIGDKISVNVGTSTFVFGIPKETVVDQMGYLLTTQSKEVGVAQPCASDTLFATKIMPYLLKSKQMQDSLKIRRTARQIKYQIIQDQLKKDTKSDPAVKDAWLKYLAVMVKSPLIVLDHPPIPEFVRDPAAGPCMMPYGVLVNDEKNNPTALETSVLCVTDLGHKGDDFFFSISDAVDNDTLDIVLCHENGHGIMYDMYGPAWFGIKRISNNGHDTPYITDQALAIIEGWAEGFEAVYGPATIQFAEKDRKKYGISEFLYTRQDPVRRDRYIWARPTGKKTGILKNALQLMSTEGVIAGQFYDILTSRAINAPLEKCLTVFIAAQPSNYPDFICTFLKLFPGDRNVLSRIVLEGTNYVTISPLAAKLYYDYYMANVGYKQKKVALEDYNKARQAYLTFKEDQFKTAAGGADLFSNVAPDLWFTGFIPSTANSDPQVLSQIEVARREARKQLGMSESDGPGGWAFHLNINTVSARMLVYLGLSEDDAQKVLTERGKRGGYKGDAVTCLSEVLGASYKSWADNMKIANLSNDAKKKESAIKQVNTLYPEDIEKLYKGSDL
ncbi:MAG: hypothetical protein HQM09_19575 [Candidatus Riflebacteria bacterium]|nr:hypothetical protein [Candidatus Riflebacteria bacterium]